MRKKADKVKISKIIPEFYYLQSVIKNTFQISY